MDLFCFFLARKFLNWHVFNFFIFFLNKTFLIKKKRKFLKQKDIKKGKDKIKNNKKNTVPGFKPFLRE